jgi:hypothetical protein
MWCLQVSRRYGKPFARKVLLQRMYTKCMSPLAYDRRVVDDAVVYRTTHWWPEIHAKSSRTPSWWIAVRFGDECAGPGLVEGVHVVGVIV